MSWKDKAAIWLFCDVNMREVGQSLKSDLFAHKVPVGDMCTVCFYGMCVLKQ